MAFFNDLGKRMNSLAQSAQKQFEVAKIQRQINDKQAECDGIFAQIGRLYYSCRQRNAMPDESINALCERMTLLNDEISDMRAHIDVLSGVVRCPACQSIVVTGSTYCSKCGAKLPQDLFKVEPEEPEKPAEPEEPEEPEEPDEPEEPEEPKEPEEPEEIEETETPEGDGSPEGSDAARKDESESDDRY